MKMLRAPAALAFLLFCAPAFAQQTAIHSVPIGKGAGNIGFNAAVPGAAGQPLVSQGPSVDPAFGTIANSGFTPGAANTAKGSLNGTNVVDLPLPNCTGVNQAWKYVSGTGINCGAVSTTGGYDMPINFGLSALASGNALTITLTQANGAAPSSSNPVIVPFRSTVGTNGTINFATISATQSITIPNGATLGTSNNVPFRVWIFEDYNGGTPELGVATCSSATTIFPCASWESTLPTSTTIGGSSNTGGVLYATAGVAADAVRIVGYCDFASGLATAGAWASACTTLQVFGPGVSRPGGTVQELGSVSASALTSQSITPSSTVNLIEFAASANCAAPASGTPVIFTFKRASTTLVTQNLGGAGTVSLYGVASTNILDQPQTTSSTSYSIGSNGGCTGTIQSAVKLREIMG